MLERDDAYHFIGHDCIHYAFTRQALLYSCQKQLTGISLLPTLCLHRLSTRDVIHIGLIAPMVMLESTGLKGKMLTYDSYASNDALCDLSTNGVRCVLEAI